MRKCKINTKKVKKTINHFPDLSDHKICLYSVLIWRVERTLFAHVSRWVTIKVERSRVCLFYNSTAFGHEEDETTRSTKFLQTSKTSSPNIHNICHYYYAHAAFEFLSCSHAFALATFLTSSS